MRQRGEDAVTVQAQQGKGGAYATEQHRGQQEDKDGEQSERARDRQHRVIGHPTETTVAVARTMRSPGFGTHPGRSIEHARRGILHTRGGAFGVSRCSALSPLARVCMATRPMITRKAVKKVSSSRCKPERVRIGARMCFTADLLPASTVPPGPASPLAPGTPASDGLHVCVQIERKSRSIEEVPLRAHRADPPLRWAVSTRVSSPRMSSLIGVRPRVAQFRTRCRCRESSGCELAGRFARSRIGSGGQSCRTRHCESGALRCCGLPSCKHFVNERRCVRGHAAAEPSERSLEHRGISIARLIRSGLSLNSSTITYGVPGGHPAPGDIIAGCVAVSRGYPGRLGCAAIHVRLLPAPPGYSATAT